MISGRTVTVLRPSAATADRFGNEVPGAAVPETVDNVLVSSGPTDDLEASRREGVVVALTLHFPKGYTESLRGCSVALTGEYEGTYRVIGDRAPYMVENCPEGVPWNRPVEVEAVHG